MKVEHKDSKNNNYLHYLSKRENPEIEMIEKMIEKGVKINQVNIDNDYPFSFLPTTFPNYQKIFEIICEKEKDLNNFFLNFCSSFTFNLPLLKVFVEQKGNPEIEAQCFSRLCFSPAPSSTLFYFIDRKVQLIPHNSYLPEMNYFFHRSTLDPSIILFFKQHSGFTNRQTLDYIIQRTFEMNLNQQNTLSLKIIFDDKEKMKSKYSSYDYEIGCPWGYAFSVSQLICLNKTINLTMIEHLVDIESDFYEMLGGDRKQTLFSILFSNPTCTIDFLKLIPKANHPKIIVWTEIATSPCLNYQKFRYLTDLYGKFYLQPECVAFLSFFDNKLEADQLDIARELLEDGIDVNYGGGWRETILNSFQKSNCKNFSIIQLFLEKKALINQNFVEDVCTLSQPPCEILQFFLKHDHGKFFENERAVYSNLDIDLPKIKLLLEKKCYKSKNDMFYHYLQNRIVRPSVFHYILAHLHVDEQLRQRILAYFERNLLDPPFKVILTLSSIHFTLSEIENSLKKLYLNVYSPFKEIFVQHLYQGNNFYFFSIYFSLPFFFVFLKKRIMVS